ncbi:extracellular solute-binding protein [Rhizobium sp. LEGMi135b]
MYTGNKKHTLTRRTVLGAGLAIPFLKLGSVRAASLQGKSIRLLTFNSLSGQLVVEHVAKPFEKLTGCRVIAELSPSAADMVAKVKASAANQQYDIVVLGAAGGRDLVDSGLAETPDLNKVPNIAKTLPSVKEGADGKALSFLLTPEGMIYNTTAFSSAPTSFEAMWDRKYQGRVVLPPATWAQATYTILRTARMAGGDQMNVEPGFARLEELRDSILMLAESPPQVAEAVRANAIAVGGSLPALYFASNLNNPQYNLAATVRLKEGLYCQRQYMVMPKGHPGDTDAILAFMDFGLSAEPQAAVAVGQFSAPVNVDSKVPANLLDKSYMVSPQSILETMVDVDEKHLAKVRGDWAKRYGRIFG